MSDYKKVSIEVQFGKISEFTAEVDFDAAVSDLINDFAVEQLGLSESGYEVFAVISIPVTGTLNATLGDTQTVELKVPKQMVTLVLRPKRKKVDYGLA